MCPTDALNNITFLRRRERGQIFRSKRKTSVITERIYFPEYGNARTQVPFLCRRFRNERENNVEIALKFPRVRITFDYSDALRSGIRDGRARHFRYDVCVCSIDCSESRTRYLFPANATRLSDVDIVKGFYVPAVLNPS